MAGAARIGRWRGLRRFALFGECPANGTDHMLGRQRCVGDQLVDAIAKDGERRECGNRDTQAEQCGDEGFRDGGREVGRRRVGLRGELPEGLYHAPDRPHQPEHRGEGADHRQVFDLTKQPGRLGGRRVFHRLLNGGMPQRKLTQSSRHDMPQKARRLAALSEGHVDLLVLQLLKELFRLPARLQRSATNAEEMLDDESQHSEAQKDDDVADPSPRLQQLADIDALLGKQSPLGGQAEVVEPAH